MRRFIYIVVSLTIISGILYGAWMALDYFDSVRSNYREELSRSQLLNQSAQQRIADLLVENAELRRQLTMAEEIPVGNFNIGIEYELEEDEEDVRY